MHALTGSEDADDLVDSYLLFRDRFQQLQIGTLSYGPFDPEETKRLFDLHAQFDMDTIDLAKSWYNIQCNLKRENEEFFLHI